MWKDSGKTNISILHSNLGDRRRYEEWNRIKRGDARIVIGTRSGIFAPIENVGVIVIDEEVFSEELLYGVTGSRKDRDIFKNNQRCT